MSKPQKITQKVTNIEKKLQHYLRRTQNSAFLFVSLQNSLNTSPMYCFLISISCSFSNKKEMG